LVVFISSPSVLIYKQDENFVLMKICIL